MAIRKNINCLLPLMLTLLLGLGACKQRESNLPFGVIEQDQGNFTGQVYRGLEPGLIVVAQPDEVTELDDWVTEASKAQLQVMDYDAYFALVVFQGMKPTDGYSVQIERIVRMGNKVTVHAQFQEPAPDRKKNDIVTSPYCLIRVQKTGTWGQNTTFNVAVDSSVVISAPHDIP